MACHMRQAEKTGKVGPSWPAFRPESVCPVFIPLPCENVRRLNRLRLLLTNKRVRIIPTSFTHARARVEPSHRFISPGLQSVARLKEVRNTSRVRVLVDPCGDTGDAP